MLNKITKRRRIVIMVTVSHIVNKLVNDKTFLQEGMHHRVISNNALATVLKPEIEMELGKEVKHSAIVMALRRYEENLRKSVGKPLFVYFSETIMKTNICHIVVSESPSLLPKLISLYHLIDFKKGGILHISQGSYQVGITTNEKYKEKLLDLLSMENILHVLDDLVSISLTYSKDFTFTPGILYNVMRFIAWENINILNVIHTPSELSIIVDNKDAVRCYKTVHKLMKKKEEEKQEKRKL
jgi:aspartokinase